MSRGNSIRAHVGASGHHAYTYYPVIVIGAGETGIAMGCQLKEQLHFDQFRIFERQAYLGGTWYSNRYPGVRCDVPAIFYSYSFALNNQWSEFHPSGGEILRYLTDVAGKYEIVDKIQFNTEVTEVRWLETERLWEATIAHLLPGIGDLTSRERKQRLADGGRDSVYVGQETVRAKVLASAAGGLVEPNPWPQGIPGLNTFEGDRCHTARWDEKIDFNDKDVIVLGTGCSGAQVVPQLIKSPYNAKSVTQIMRTPPWVMPVYLPISKAQWERWIPTLMRKVPGFARLIRLFIYLETEKDFLHIIRLKPSNVERRRKYEEKLIQNLKSKVPYEYVEMLTPNYSAGCKRRIVDDDWLTSFQDPKVTLTTQPLKRVGPNSITLGARQIHLKISDAHMKDFPERTVPADVIILANGFELSTFLHPLRIIGKGGRLLQDVWNERGGPQAYMGTAMDGFPNAFILFGPNTATGHSSVILASENMVNYSLKFIKKILNDDVEVVEVKKEAELAWTKTIQEKCKETVYQSGGCASWYKGEDGWNSTTYPFSQTDYSIRCMFPRWRDWDLTYSKKGFRKMVFRRFILFFVFVITVVRGPRLYRSMRSMTTMLPFLKAYIRFALVRGLSTAKAMIRG